MFAILICGAYGKNLTITYLNYFLIKAGYKVLLLNLTPSENIHSAYVNNEYVSCQKDEEIENIYNQYECDVVLARSSRLDPQLNVIVSGLVKVDAVHPINIMQEGFMRRNFPLVITNQTEEVSGEIYKTTMEKMCPAFISEHYHINYKKHDIGLPVSYAYQNYTLALTISEIFKEMHPAKGVLKLVKTEGLKRVKPNKHYFFSYPLPSILPIPKDITFGPYYGNIIKKNNITYHLDAANNGTASNHITKWFEMSCLDKDIVKLCIFYKEPSNDLIHTMVPLSAINFETFYIVDYDTYGNNYTNLKYIFFDDVIIIGENVPWAETNYESISGIMNDTAYNSIRYKFNPKAGQFNIVVDNLNSIQSWIDKYTKSHDDTDFRILITGSKKIIDDSLSFIKP